MSSADGGGVSGKDPLPASPASATANLVAFRGLWLFFSRQYSLRGGGTILWELCSVHNFTASITATRASAALLSMLLATFKKCQNSSFLKLKIVDFLMILCFKLGFQPVLKMTFLALFVTINGLW